MLLFGLFGWLFGLFGCLAGCFGTLKLHKRADPLSIIYTRQSRRLKMSMSYMYTLRVCSTNTLTCYSDAVCLLAARLPSESILTKTSHSETLLFILALQRTGIRWRESFTGTCRSTQSLLSNTKHPACDALTRD